MNASGTSSAASSSTCAWQCRIQQTSNPLDRATRHTSKLNEDAYRALPLFERSKSVAPSSTTSASPFALIYMENASTDISTYKPSWPVTGSVNPTVKDADREKRFGSNRTGEAPKTPPSSKDLTFSLNRTRQKKADVMAKKKRGTEGYLDTFSETLRSYEKLVVQRITAIEAVAKIDRDLEGLREQLLHLAGGQATPISIPSLLPTGSKRSAKSSAPKAKKAPRLASKLVNEDPRVQRSLGGVLDALQAAGGSAHLNDLGKKIGISPKAVALRMTRGIKLGLIRKVGKGTYALR